jgi:hypothetical protein
MAKQQQNNLGVSTSSVAPKLALETTLNSLAKPHFMLKGSKQKKNFSDEALHFC